MKKILKAIRDLFNHKVLLCDLDWTLIVTKSGKTFPVDENDWEFKDGIKEAIQKYNPKYIFIISNQGGIEKGYVDNGKFYQKLQTIIATIRTWGNFIVDGTYCTSNDKDHYFRKPNVGMVDFFRHGYVMGYDFDNRNALMIGDMETDQECAKNAGIKYIDVEDFINHFLVVTHLLSLRGAERRERTKVYGSPSRHLL